MAKHKDRPEQEQHNGGDGGAGQHQQQTAVIEPATGVPPNTPQTVVGSPVDGQGMRLDVPTARPPGYSASPGSFVTPGGHSWQAPGFPPPPLGRTPVGIQGLAVPLPIGTKATHFSGPLVSGGIPQTPLWKTPGSTPPAGPLPVGGSAILTTTFAVDFSMGNFTVPVQFPHDSLIVGHAAVTLVPFTAAPSAALGKTSGASDIFAAAAMPAENAPLTFTAATGQLPLYDAVLPQLPFQAFLTVSGNTGGTAGMGLVLIQYVRIPQRWT